MSTARTESVQLADPDRDRAGLSLDARVSVPSYVVYREFVNETVTLNLSTGSYYGLNPTAGTMLRAVEAAETLREAAAALASDTGWELPTVENDLLDLCQTLLEGGLLEVPDGGST
jgi:hypothetical protein